MLSVLVISMQFPLVKISFLAASLLIKNFSSVASVGLAGLALTNLMGLGEVRQIVLVVFYYCFSGSNGWCG